MHNTKGDTKVAQNIYSEPGQRGAANLTASRWHDPSITATSALEYVDGVIDLCHKPVDDDDEGGVLNTIRPRGSETRAQLLARYGLAQVFGASRGVDTAEGTAAEFDVEAIDA